MISVGDCLDVLAEYQDDVFDACVTDPPYGLEFMGKAWDHGVPGIPFWSAVYRVLKPGAYLVAFGGTRTSHRLVCAIEDAGFEIRDSLVWLYGSGFPKSKSMRDIGRPELGTALKPGHEPVVLARKPLIGTVATNVLTHGTGALNVDGCRIAGVVPQVTQGATDAIYGGGKGLRSVPMQSQPHDSGRWPANVILDDEAGAMLDAQSGERVNGGQNETSKGADGMFGVGASRGVGATRFAGDTGGASRFFYCAKASKKEREIGLADFESTNVNDGRATSIDNPYQRGDTQRKNTHPTVKPLALMRWLVRLVTPPDGLVLDPFLGSGTTAIACKLEGFECDGIEQLLEYANIARARLGAYDG